MNPAVMPLFKAFLDMHFLKLSKYVCYCAWSMV